MGTDAIDKSMLYVSSVLVCGFNSATSRANKTLSLNILKDAPSISAYVYNDARSGLNQIRSVRYGKRVPFGLKFVHESLASRQPNSSSYPYIGDLSHVATFSHDVYNVNVSDSVFSEGVDIPLNNGEDIIKNKVDKVYKLLRVIYNGEKDMIPLIMRDFPNITSAILKYPYIIEQ